MKVCFASLGREPQPAKVLAKNKRNKYALRNARRYIEIIVMTMHIIAE